MEKLKTAVITTSNSDFERYKNLQSEAVQQNLCKISILRDIKEKKYGKAVLLVHSDNVPNRVINEVKELSLSVENLSDKTFYN